MKITVTSTEEEFDIAAAWRIISEIVKKPNAVIGLSTGQTTIGSYKNVAKIYSQFPFDTSGTTFFNVDELINVPRDYPGSCYSRILNEIVKPLAIKEENFIMPQTISTNYTAECKKFEEQIKALGGIDLQILGIGTNGHIGFNQPGTPFESETRVSVIDPVLETRIRKELSLRDNHELGGITLGIKNIMQARKVILVAKGESKAEIIKKALLGPVTTEVPASILQLHPNCEILIDAAAAAKIK